MKQKKRYAAATLTLTLGLCACFPALAQDQLADADTGLGIRVPAGFSVARGVPRSKQDVVFNVRSTHGEPVAKNADGTLCGVTFVNAPANASLSQAEINEWVSKPEWRNLAKATLEMVFRIEQIESTQLDGVTGTVFSATPKSDTPNQDVFMQLTIFETPRGRTSMACVTSQGGAKAATPVFSTIRAGIQLPR